MLRTVFTDLAADNRDAAAVRRPSTIGQPLPQFGVAVDDTQHDLPLPIVHRAVSEAVTDLVLIGQVIGLTCKPACTMLRRFLEKPLFP
jgi:hypothetical protein